MSRVDVAALYERHARSVYRRVLRFFPPAEAEEVVHEIFVKALENIDAFRHASSPATWLYRVTTNHCINKKRDSSRRAELWREQAPVLWGDTAAASDQEARLALAQLWAELDDDAVTLAVMYFLDGMSHAEIARVLEVSRRTVGNRLDALRERLERAVDSSRQPQSSGSP